MPSCLCAFVVKEPRRRRRRLPRAQDTHGAGQRAGRRLGVVAGAGGEDLGGARACRVELGGDAPEPVELALGERHEGDIRRAKSASVIAFRPPIIMAYSLRSDGAPDKRDGSDAVHPCIP